MLEDLKLTGQEEASVQAAYDTLTEVGARTGWSIGLVDEAHQKLGVLLAVLYARRLQGKLPGRKPGLSWR